MTEMKKNKISLNESALHCFNTNTLKVALFIAFMSQTFSHRYCFCDLRHFQ